MAAAARTPHPRGSRALPYSHMLAWTIIGQPGAAGERLATVANAFSQCSGDIAMLPTPRGSTIRWSGRRGSVCHDSIRYSMQRVTPPVTTINTR